MTGNETARPHPDPAKPVQGHAARSALMQSTALDSTPEGIAQQQRQQTQPAGTPPPIDAASSESAPLGPASRQAALDQAGTPAPGRTPPEHAVFDREAAREAAIDALLPHVPAEGWTTAALRAHAGADADLLFPGGPPDMIDAYIALADRRMAADAGPDLAAMRLPDRVKALILARLRRAEPHRAAIRRSLAILALPVNAALAARTLARTVDEIWHEAGDRSADFSWYTKRAILASVYSSTLLFWLNERNTLEDAEAFLDRRLAGVARITRLRRRLAA